MESGSVGKQEMEAFVKHFKEVAKLVRSSDRYEIYDLETDDRIFSMTFLREGKETSGHSHNETDEYYFFIDGDGEMQINKTFVRVSKLSTAYVPNDSFHKVFNKGKGDLTFLAIFKPYSGHNVRGMK